MNFSDAHDVATEALETFHKIEDGAARLLATRSGEASDVLAVINTFTNTAAVAKIASISDATTKSLLSLVREPAVSRVVAETDEGEVVTYYICRTTNITVKGTMLAGYRTPIGRLAVFDVGESVELEVAGKQRGYRILEKLELKPLKRVTTFGMPSIASGADGVQPHRQSLRFESSFSPSTTTHSSRCWMANLRQRRSGRV